MQTESLFPREDDLDQQFDNLISTIQELRSKRRKEVLALLGTSTSVFATAVVAYLSVQAAHGCIQEAIAGFAVAAAGIFSIFRLGTTALNACSSWDEEKNHYESLKKITVQCRQLLLLRSRLAEAEITISE